MAKLIYLTALGRSGSTVFERYAAMNLDIFALGEMTYAIERGIIENERCGCGVPFGECDFWKKFRELLERRFSAEEIRLLAIEQRRAESTLGFYLLRYKRVSSILDRYYQLQAEFIRSLPHEYAFDTSKRPVRPILLKRYLKQDEIQIVELVREPAAVAYSWTKSKVRVESTTGASATMPAVGYYKSVARWINVAIVSSRIRKRIANTVLIKYEDFVMNPDSAIAVLKAKPSSKGVDSAERYHPVSGNPSRFEPMKISPDIRWVTEVSPIKKIVTNVLTAPFKLLYRV
ncbi:hypothetical protein [Pseudooceanicola lipolyticus]|uniref:hypothetical protein n=1 Tax=Pseudooceanicola lipolyticus TaxID=2029104 RepID=UPI0010566DEC|nr:hypothetical protein [Pseudooceanicola lipolyticus]